MPVYVYMLRCKNNSLYTGWTTDLKARLEKHQAGKGAKYTQAFGVTALVYYEQLEDKTAALKREYALKQLPKKDKESLVEGFKLKLLEKSNKN